VFIDTSAFIAILTGAPEAARLADVIAAAKRVYTSPVVRLETCMRLSTMLDVTPLAAQALFDAMRTESKIDVIAVTDDVGELAVSAFERFGKGRGNKAKLNLADCLSYACAKAHYAPILCIGRDFANTDIPLALAPGP